MRQVCCGKSHTLLVTEGGIVWSWGGNRRGQLGHGTFQSNSYPRCVSELMKPGTFQSGSHPIVSVIACGDYHSVCIVEPGGRLFYQYYLCIVYTIHITIYLKLVVYVWGAGEMLGNGTGTSNDNSVPIVVPMFKRRRAQTLVSGESHIAVISNNEIFAWGSNARGQLGRPVNDENLHSNTPLLVIFPRLTESQTNRALLIAGPKHTFLVTREAKSVKSDDKTISPTIRECVKVSKVFVWGHNKFGQCGVGSSTETIQLPTKVFFPSITGKLSEAIDCVHTLQTCANSTICRTKSGEVFVWGVLNLISLSKSTSSIPTPVRIHEILPNLDEQSICDVNIVSSRSMSLTLIDIDRSSSFVMSTMLSPSSKIKGLEPQLRNESITCKQSVGRTMLSSFTKRNASPWKPNFKSKPGRSFTSPVWSPLTDNRLTSSDSSTICVHVGGVSVPFMITKSSRTPVKTEGNISMASSSIASPVTGPPKTNPSLLFNDSSIREMTSLIQSLKTDSYLSSSSSAAAAAAASPSNRY